MGKAPEALSQAFELGYTYTRSTGPVVGRFLTALRDRQLVGVRASDGRVLVPPVEYDPVSAAALNEFVEVGDTGVVKTWSWVREPRSQHPLQKPFAWALIQLDGADSPLLHCIDAPGPEAMRSGMRVQVRWADDTRGHITDIACFEPVEGADAVRDPGDKVSGELVTGMDAPTYLQYHFTAGAS
ncbi:MAG TPA: OB-fold domain-containing protein, partial [Spongiibacteraceae bacterium]|nr:OB-fold domain-containing protein [Spongiibacteraceae bacterium]